MPDTTVKLQDITPVKSTFDNDDQLLLINPTGEARISKEDFLDAMPDDALTLIGDITTTGIEGDTVAKQLGALKNSKAPAITETTESSAIANFTDGADNMVMHNVVAEINPVQSGSGDPSPSNIRPISGWTGCNVTRTGKNLWNKDRADAQNGYYFLSGEFHADNYYRCLSFPCSPGDKFIKSGSGWGGIVTFWNGTTFVSGVNSTTVTVPNGANIVKFACQYSSTNAQLELGSIATDYEAYQATTVTVDWTSEAGTVYGGTIDVATGLLTVDRAMVDLGTLDWTKSSVSRDNAMFVSMDLQSVIKAPPSTQDVTNAVSSVYAPTTAINALSTNNTNGTFAVNTHKTNPSANGQLYVVDNAYADATAFKTAMNGVQLCYELATPQTYQLTPQQLMALLGTNNVWADTGNVSVTYPADTKMYIQNLTQPTEDDLVANQAITSGKYFMIGNSLYLALANIASGAQITIGTNAQRVSLADALNNINS